MSGRIGQLVKVGLGLGLAGSILAAAAMPAQAGDGGAIAAGILGGTALGVLAGATLANPPPPPPPPYYYGPAAGRCWYEHRRVWDGYDGVWVVRPIRVCD
jgi:hypothetical protein